jgi:hypothetical protein
MSAADEAAMRRQRRGMRRAQHAMAVAVDHLALGLRVAAPQQEDKAFAFAIQRVHHMVGEPLPALACMGTGAAFLDREHGVQQQHALPRPRQQAAVVRTRDADVALQFLEDVVQRRRHGNARLHGEAQPVRLSRTVVGILAEHHDLDVVERRGVERTEDARRRRKDARARLPAFAQERRQLLHVLALQVVADARLP